MYIALNTSTKSLSALQTPRSLDSILHTLCALSPLTRELSSYALLDTILVQNTMYIHAYIHAYIHVV